MRLLAALLLSLTISGCAYQKYWPWYPQFPEQKNPALFEKCPDLKTIETDTVSITEFLKAVTDNYKLYYECSLKNDGWIEWYNTQKKIWEKKP